VLDVRPGGNQGTEHHKAEGEESQRGDRATEPKDLAVSDQDNSQVLEDGIDGDRKELKGLGAGVDHADQQKSDREP